MLVPAPPPESPATRASTLQLPRGPWATVFECLCAHFPAIPSTRWADRFRRSRILDAAGRPIDIGHPYRPGTTIRYFREVASEQSIPFAERILHVDEHIVVADKPHFLAVMPAGRFVEETLLYRLSATLGAPDLVPLHRIDRGTAGLVMFSLNRASRSMYQALFRGHRIEKSYEALAAPLPDLDFPLVRRSRIVPGEPFFRMCEVEGAANSESRLQPIERGDARWLYALQPVTGRKHQLRVHMAALGAAIDNDAFYPDLSAEADDDFHRPLKLLARSLRFVDPISGAPRRFESARTL
jgi:tRNA pseudouridine32 synthase/23S rRNA pseudouridine746 synthase